MGVGGLGLLSLVLLSKILAYLAITGHHLNINMTLDTQLAAESQAVSDTTSLSKTNMSKRSIFLEKCRMSSVQSYPLHIKQDARSCVHY